MSLIHVRENRRVNQEWTIQRHWQYWVHKTTGRRQTKQKYQQVIQRSTFPEHLSSPWRLVAFL